MTEEDVILKMLGRIRHASGSTPSGLGCPDAIAAQLEKSDTPYRAWAAVALLTAPSARHRTKGKYLAIDLATWMPATEDLQHADLAAYALIDGAGFLTADQRDRLRAALPFPHADRERRARLYASSAFVYMLARGVGPSLSCAANLVRVIDEELELVTERGAPDLVDLSLLFAARLELISIAPVTEAVIRRVAGRFTGAEGSREGAVALHWLLEIYGDRWPAGDDAAALRETARTVAERMATPHPLSTDYRPVVLAMLLEISTRRAPQFQLVTRASVEEAIAARLGRRRLLEGAAYLLIIAGVAGGPMYAAAHAGWIVPLVAWAGGLGLGVPAATWALLFVIGGPRNTMVLGAGTTLGVAYCAAALYAGYTHTASLLRFLGGEGALLELFLAAVASLWAGVNAVRDR